MGKAAGKKAEEDAEEKEGVEAEEEAEEEEGNVEGRERKSAARGT